MCRVAQPDHRGDGGNQHRGVRVGRGGREGQGHLHEASTGRFSRRAADPACVCRPQKRADPGVFPPPSSQLLYGHTDSVTCLAVSELHGVIVSGSRDLTCILWDMEELGYVTQLSGHAASVSSLAINDLTVSPAHAHAVAMVLLSTLSFHWGD